MCKKSIPSSLEQSRDISLRTQSHSSDHLFSPIETQMKIVLREQGTQTNQPLFQLHRFYDLSLQHVLKFISSLLLPLMLGIFTVVITIHQQNAVKMQRAEDQNTARQQRELERELANDRYQSQVLDTYIKEIGDLLKESNGSLTSNQVTATIARVKTLNIFRQLDPRRNTRIIRFLYEAGQLTSTVKQTPLDLSTAELDGIDLSQAAIDGRMQNISLAGAYVHNTNFMDANIEYVNFSRARLFNATFSHAKLYGADYFRITLSNNTDFSYAQLYKANFSSVTLHNANFSNAQLSNTTFSHARLFNVNFSHARLSYTEIVKHHVYDDTISVMSSEDYDNYTYNKGRSLTALMGLDDDKSDDQIRNIENEYSDDRKSDEDSIVSVSRLREPGRLNPFPSQGAREKLRLTRSVSKFGLTNNARTALKTAASQKKAKTVSPSGDFSVDRLGKTDKSSSLFHKSYFHLHS